MEQIAAIILAAGISSRMQTDLAKVLHQVCGRPMLAWVLDACRGLGVQKIYVVVGFGAEQVKAHFGQAADIIWVEQPEQKGTADAVRCCKEHLADFKGLTLVLCGDGPLVRTETLQALVRKHNSEGAAATLATAVLDDPTGYGRIIRDQNGNIKGIVEHNDCSPEQLAIHEVNPSYYLFDNQVLFEAVEKVKPDNTKQEYYLTDVVGLIIAQGRKVAAVKAVSAEEAISVNSREQLSQANKIMQRRIQRGLMNNGVTIIDPDSTWIDGLAEIGRDTVIEPFTFIDGRVRIGRHCRVGPFAYVAGGTVLEDGAEIKAATSALGEGIGRFEPQKTEKD